VVTWGTSQNYYTRQHSKCAQKSCAILGVHPKEKKAFDWSVGSLYVVFLRMVAGDRNVLKIPRIRFRFEIQRASAS
jgi:hypothetical protein